VAAWRDVARRLAHEIKNPLTPIQLCAERLRRYFSQAPAETHALVDECTDAIITEVEALKGPVDEFAQFARLRGPRHCEYGCGKGDSLHEFSFLLSASSPPTQPGRCPPLRWDPCFQHQI
jgi:two-component system nitrogen regulation sensor histidine kinase NtrY